MLIDWFTVGAQVINFVILIWLLKKFLYGPVLSAMDEREAIVRGELEQARREKELAELKSRQLEKERQDLAGARNDILSKAQEQARDLENRLTSLARQEVELRRQKWEEILEQEKRQFLNKVRQKAGSSLVLALEKILKDISASNLQQKMFTDLLHKLEQTRLNHSTQKTEIVVRSAFELNNQQKKQIGNILNSSHESQIRFEEDANLIAGIEVLIAGHKIGWSLGQYLQDMETEMENLLSAAGTAHE